MKKDTTTMAWGLAGLSLAALGYYLLKKRTPGLGELLPYAEALIKQAARPQLPCTTCNPGEIEMQQTPNGVWQPKGQ